MADRIVAWRLLDGKTRIQVTEMLGEPPKTDYFTEWEMVYWLGPERGFMSIDSEWLLIKFTSDAIVSEYRLARD